MNPTLILSSIIFFIVSLVGCLILTLTANKIKHKILKKGIIIHGILGVISLLLLIINQPNEQFSIAYFCSGLLLAGIVLRNYQNTILKIYFGLFLSLILFFGYSPSLLVYFISGNYSKVKSPQTINLKDNYYLGEQQSMLNLNNQFTTYKIYKKNGIYKKTILRDIDFGGSIDSIKLITFTEDTLIIKGYKNGQDTTIYKKPGVHKKGDIRIKKNNSSK